jgi:ABC-type multidrug transport system ATPase subunit
LRLADAPASCPAQQAPVGTRVPVLNLQGVSKRWPRQPRPVLDNVDLSVGPGTAILLTGRNGAGKTTLLRIASGLIAPDSGRISVQGLNPERSRREFNRRICLLAPRDSGLYARLSVRRHLDLAARLALLSRADRATSVEHALDAFDLRELGSNRVDRLSTGQRQRVRVAMAFLHVPQLALLDEPSKSLDDQGMALLGSALADLLSRGGAAIVCEPSGNRGELAYDRRLILQDGVLNAA